MFTNPVCLIIPVGYVADYQALPLRPAISAWDTPSWFTGEDDSLATEWSLRLYRMHHATLNSAVDAARKADSYRHQGGVAAHPQERTRALRSAERFEQLAATARPSRRRRASPAGSREGETGREKPYRKATGPASQQAVRRTLRAALNAAIAQQLITFNPAAHVELESGKRPKPLLWTDERVRRWRETGETPGAVMVWTPQQFGVFLDAAEDDRLYAFFHLSGTRGLRRGEGVGQDWSNVDLDAGRITPAKEIVVDGWGPYESDPKTDGSADTIALDSLNVAVLRAHKTRQEAERREWGEAWQDTGKVFTTEDGSWLHPETVSAVFGRILARTDLPPITLRDLRHVAATLTHGGGGDIHAVKSTLRQSTIALTSDTYTSLLPELDEEIAEKAAGLVLRARQNSETDGESETPAHASLTQEAP